MRALVMDSAGGFDAIVDPATETAPANNIEASVRNRCTPEWEDANRDDVASRRKGTKLPLARASYV